MLWCHKYNPVFGTNIQNIFEYHVRNIQKLFDFHLLVYGHVGVGKKTIVQLVMKELNMESNLRKETIQIVNEKKEIDIVVHSSRRHIEILITPYGNNERYVMKYFINELSKHMSIDDTGRLTYKHFIIYNIEHISQSCQQLLNVFMDKYHDCCRFVFVTNCINKVTQTLQTRCMTYRVSLLCPTILQSYCQQIIAKEKNENNHMKNVSVLQIKRIIQSHQTLDNILYALQCKCLDIKDIFHDIIVEITKHIQKNNSKQVRELTYMLLVNNIEPTEIIKSILIEVLLIKNIEPSIAYEIIHNASILEYRLLSCERPIYHIEAFTQITIQLLHKKKQ